MPVRQNEVIKNLIVSQIVSQRESEISAQPSGNLFRDNAPALNPVVRSIYDVNRQNWERVIQSRNRFQLTLTKDLGVDDRLPIRRFSYLQAAPVKSLGNSEALEGLSQSFNCKPSAVSTLNLEPR